VYRHLGSRQREDQPPAPSIDMLEAEHVSEKGTISLSVGTEHDDMRTKDHAAMLLRGV
jgi:hypothetical protein